MVQLRAIPGAARYAGDSLDSIVNDALNEAQTLASAGFSGVQLQNMGDSPSSRHASLETVAFMTRACVAVRSTFPELQLSVLVNWDAEASLAVAEAAGADYVRVEHTAPSSTAARAQVSTGQATSGIACGSSSSA